MSLRTISRTIVTVPFTAAKLPLDAIAKRTGPRGEALVDRADATVRDIAGRLTGDRVLREDAARRSTAATERTRAADLRDQAEARRAVADDRAEDREAAADQRREQAAKAEKERKAKAAERERKAKAASHKAKAKTDERNAEAERADRLEALDARAEAAEDRGEAITAADEARRLADAADTAKTVRKA
jgi:hypothetical protein